MKNMDLRLIPIILFLLLSFFLWRGLSLDPHHLPSAVVGKSLPDFILPQLQNSQNKLASIELRDRVVLLNVWASWCQACIDEQAFLLQLAREGVPIYGLNYKDQWGNPYRLTAQDIEGKVAIDLGVYGAPETFVIDKQGIIRYRHAGVMNQQIWSKEILPLMKQLEDA